MPRLWTATLEEHRREVRDAILNTAAALAAELGPLSVTMSQIAEDAGIGRATLYKYFPDVETILRAWHEREVGRHLRHLGEVRDRADAPTDRLEAVLDSYALMVHASRQHRDTELAKSLHGDDRLAPAERQLREMLRDLLRDAATAGDVRGDVAPAELAVYCLRALAAAGDLPSRTAVRRLVGLTLAGLRPPPS